MRGRDPRLLLLPVAAALLLLWQQRVALRQSYTDVEVLWRALLRLQTELSAERQQVANLTRQVTSWRTHWELIRPHYDALKDREARNIAARIAADALPKTGLTLQALARLEGLVLPKEGETE